MVSLVRSVVSLVGCALPYRRFHAMAARLQDVKDEMQDLNGRRQKAQKEIIELCGHVTTCRTCAGLCCRGAYNHFTPVDCLIRMFSDSPVADYGKGLLKPVPLYQAIPRKIFELIRSEDEFDRKRPTFRPPTEGGCPDLTPTGCRFAPEDRPIRCVLWTCLALRRDWSMEDLRRVSGSIKELQAVSRQAVRLLR